MAGKHAIRPRRRWPRRVLITTNVLVALAIVAVGSAYGYVQFRLDQVQRVLDVPSLAPMGSSDPKSQSHVERGVPLPPFTMLVIGSDTRALGAASNPAFGSESTAGGARSDSVLLLRVIPNQHALSLFSIPRDTLVNVPGFGKTRINAAFNSGNPNLLVKVLDQDFGIQVNHVAEFNFATFDDIANAIGGVYQWFPTPAKDAFSDLNITQAGCVLLNGPVALAFARSREYQYYLNGEWHYQQFPESDLGRIQRQQDFVKLAAKKAQQIAPTNPLALNNLIGSMTKDVKLDTGFSNSLILDLIKDFRNANLGNIPSYTYPTVNSTSVAGALDPDVALGKQTIRQWLTVAPPPPPTTSTTTPPAGGQAGAKAGAKTGTSSGAASSTVPTTVDPAHISVEVVNGSGQSGQAAQAADILDKAGYRTSDQGDVTFGHARTEIAYAPDARADATQLRAQMSGRPKLVEDPSLADSPYNLELITGNDFDSLIAGASVATTTTTTTTTTTLPPQTSAAFVGSATVQPDSSSFYKGQYIPPGRVAGQIPKSCPN